MKPTILAAALASTLALACAGPEGDPGPDTGAAPDASAGADATDARADASTPDADAPDADAPDADQPDADQPDAASGDADVAPTATLRARICGDTEWTFTREGIGAPEVVAEEGMLDGQARAFAFLEGPVWREGELYFSDFNTSSALAEDDSGPPTIVWRLGADGAVTNTWPEGSVRSNGMALGEDGAFYISDHAARGVTRVSEDGARDVLVDSFMGQTLNATNDLVLTSDGSIYFTDPTYGSQVDGRPTPLGFEGVYRLTPGGELQLIDDTLRRPNGVTVSPDERTLYVASKDEDKVYQYPLVDGVAGERSIFVEGQSTDGMAVDCAGTVYLAVPGKALRAFDPAGNKVWETLSRKSLTNLAFGGPNHDILYATEQRRLHRIQMVTPGMPY